MPFNLTLILSLIHIHSLSPVLVVMMKSKELKTKIYSHAHSLILYLTVCLSHWCCSLTHCGPLSRCVHLYLTAFLFHWCHSLCVLSQFAALGDGGSTHLGAFNNRALRTRNRSTCDPSSPRTNTCWVYTLLAMENDNQECMLDKLLKLNSKSHSYAYFKVNHLSEGRWWTFVFMGIVFMKIRIVLNWWFNIY